MTSSAKRGETIILVISVSAIVLSLALFLMTLFITQVGDIAKFLIRFAITIWLIWSLLKGKRWARVVCVVLALAGGVFALVSSINLLNDPTGASRVLVLSLGVAGVLYCWGGLVLVFSQNVSSFFKESGKLQASAQTAA